jgi:hypothetical protein
MKITSHLFAGLCAFALGLSPAAAQQILTHIVSTPAVDAPSGAFTNWTKTLSLPAFDASLGTLTGVKLTFTGTALQTARGENLGGSPAPFDYNISTQLSLARAGGGVLFAPGPIVLAGTGTNAAFDGSIDFAGASGFAATQTLTVTGSLTDPAAGSLADFTVPGTIDFIASALATSAVTGSGQFVSQTISKASASLAVEYTYAPIPEPAQLTALLAGVSTGWVLLRRRRSATKPLDASRA